MSKSKIYVVDDEVDLANFIGKVAETAGFDVEIFNHAEEFKNHYLKNADVIILDLIMPGIDGIEIIRFLAQIKCNAQLIVISGFDSSVLHSAKQLATEQGLNLVGSLSKPFRAPELTQLLKSLSITPKNQYSRNQITAPSPDELRSAFTNNELVVHYQPKVEIHDSPMASVEALVRWQHPEHGIIYPDLFIPMAEQNGLIDDLTWIVLEQAMTQCRNWADQGLDVQIAINMSAHTLKELDIPEKMGKMTEKYGLKPEQIVLEITESALMKELIKSLDILTRLRMKGFNLSIDDFGTGYSSLIQLYRAPFSEIKVDRSFVAEMENETEAATIVETIIMMGHKLNMKTVAEGVETEFCKSRLKELKCDQAQGYLFAKPMPGEDILSWFTKYGS